MKQVHFFFALTPLLCALAVAKVSLPVPSQYVEDKANIINAQDEQRLNSVLKELEQKTGAQFIVLTVNSTNGIPIEQYSIELVEHWKLGQAGKDNGFLLTVAFSDRKYRFEVGYGLEGFLTDQYTGRLGRDILVPAMRANRPSEGIYQASLAVANSIAGHYGVQLSGIPSGYREPTERPRRGAPCCFQVVPLIFILLMLMAALGRGSLFWPLWLLLGSQYGASRNPHNRRQRDYWGYGGGLGGGFGGRGGGFGGGRGGGFGGGGASGGW
jgi:uncharacterized protein